jgi:Spy/CpxP family protein refolding chaperone
MIKRLIAVLVLMTGVATVHAADLNLPQGKWWENERVIQRVGLTADQQRTIRDLVYEHAHRMIDLNAALKKAELELADSVERDDFDPKAVRQAFAAFQDARRRLETERFEMLLAVRQSLTSEQWDELLEIRRTLERIRENRRPGQHPPRPGAPRGDRPPDGGYR